MARVLVFDAESYLCEMYVRELESDGHEVLQAASLEEAQDALATCRLDFVVMDVTQWPIDKAYDIVRLLPRLGRAQLVLNILHDSGQTHFMPLADKTHLVKSSGLSGVNRKIREMEAVPLTEGQWAPVC
jgi:CheY-like chemotaxis protein